MRAASSELASRLHRAIDSAVIAASVSRTGVSEDAALMNVPFVWAYEITPGRYTEAPHRLGRMRRGRARAAKAGRCGLLVLCAIYERQRNCAADARSGRWVSHKALRATAARGLWRLMARRGSVARAAAAARRPGWPPGQSLRPLRGPSGACGASVGCGWR